METSGLRVQRSEACLVLTGERPPLGSPRARRALPLPAARGRGRSRRREEGAAEKGQPGSRGGGGAAPLPARLRPRARAGRSALLPGCSRPPAAARSQHCSRSSPARWVSSLRPGAHRRGWGDQPAPGPPQQRPLAAPGGSGSSAPACAAPAPVGSRVPAAAQPASRLPASFRPELAASLTASPRRHPHRKRE